MAICFFWELEKVAFKKTYFVKSITLGRVSQDHYEQNNSCIHDEGVVLFSNAGKRMIF